MRSIEDLIADLAVTEIEARVRALVELEGHGAAALEPLARAVCNASASEISRVWAISAICRIGDDRDSTCSRALRRALEDRAAVVRWAALHGLGALRVESAVAEIARHLDDHAESETAWFEDDCLVSHAAAAALRKIGPAEALQALEHERAG